jgi:hypothetical protein
MGWKGGKEMNVIGHDDIAPNGDIMLPGGSRKNAKSVVNFITCQEPLAFVRVERDESRKGEHCQTDERAWEDAAAIVS